MLINWEYGPGQQNPQMIMNISTKDERRLPSQVDGNATGMDVKRLSYQPKGNRPKTSKQIYRHYMNTIDSSNQELPTESPSELCLQASLAARQ